MKQSKNGSDHTYLFHLNNPFSRKSDILAAIA